MALFPRRRSGRNRFTRWQVGLFFLASGIWLGGLIAGRPEVTGAAIGVLLVAVVLGWVGRERNEE